MLIVTLVIIVILVIFRLPVVKGFFGEFIVKLALDSTSKNAEEPKFVYNNLILELENGKTAQIDHVLINNKGVFVIETKNFSGRIYGDDMQKEWTQVLNYGRVKNRFYNPVKQNFTHVHHIKKLLPPETPIYPVVVFLKGNIRFIKSQYVYNLISLLRLIRKTPTTALSANEIVSINSAINSNDKSHIISNAEHIKRIKMTQNDISKFICPRCNGTLIERNGKHGKFLGCSNYPDCRFTKRL